MRLIDLSHPIAHDMPRFSPDWPAPTLTPYLSHTQSAFSGRYTGTTVEISFAQFITSIGTYLDAPFHFNPDGQSIERLDLSQLVLPGVLLNVRQAGPRQALGPDLLAGLDLAGKAILFHSGWSAYWGMPQYADHPFIGEELAAALRDSGARLVGVDFQNVDDTQNPRRPAHVTLLHANVLIVENLTGLADLPKGPFTFHAVPAKVAGAAAFPVRAYAVGGESHGEGLALPAPPPPAGAGYLNSWAPISSR